MSFDTAVIIILLFVISGLLYYFNRRLSTLPTNQPDQTLLEWLKTMQNSLENTNKTLNDALNNNSSHLVRTLQENSRQLNDRLDKAASVIKEVGIEVGQMSEIGRSMKELQTFLKSPKLRGNIGEEILTDLIEQMFPKQSFNLQYTFQSGEKVDAAIKTDAGILPIDAKFPLENFQKMVKTEDEIEKQNFQKEFIRDVKKHIENIAKKYILPNEGTMDFALMYIPSETIYYEIVNTVEIMSFSRRQRIYIVSPSTLYAHLQTILLSYEGKKVEARSKEIFKLLRSLQIDYEKLQENLNILGKHLNNASAQYGQVTISYSQFGKKLQTSQLIEAENESI